MHLEGNLRGAANVRNGPEADALTCSLAPHVEGAVILVISPDRANKVNWGSGGELAHMLDIGLAAAAVALMSVAPAQSSGETEWALTSASPYEKEQLNCRSDDESEDSIFKCGKRYGWNFDQMTMSSRIITFKSSKRKVASFLSSHGINMNTLEEETQSVSKQEAQSIVLEFLKGELEGDYPSFSSIAAKLKARGGIKNAISNYLLLDAAERVVAEQFILFLRGAAPHPLTDAMDKWFAEASHLRTTAEQRLGGSAPEVFPPQAPKSDLDHPFPKIVDAFETGEWESVERLFETYPEMRNFRVPYFVTWLHYAASEAPVNLLDHLVEMGCDINAVGLEGQTPIVLAARRGDEDAVRFFLAKGAKLDISSSMVNPLFGAVLGKSSEVVRLLLDHGIDASVRYTENWNNMDALAFATMWGENEIADIIAGHLAQGEPGEKRALLERASAVADANVEPVPAHGCCSDLEGDDD